MSAATDRNLLLGVIALQMDFITREALIAAMHGWVLEKKTPLSQILVDQGTLTGERRTLLDALVEEHLKVHDGDPRKSLASVSSIGSVRQDLSRICDADLTASLPLVSAATKDQGDDPNGTLPPPSVGDSTSAGTRFRILRPHAKGGLGEVYLARDNELNRDVALKEIQDRFADDPRHRSRFEFEAEITGGLEHPGIVPVYGLGHTPGGRPFYAMRFINGNSLKDAIQRFHEDEKQPGRDPGQSTLELRDLLARFIDVCDAIAYAHNRRVLHRDLKPGNIMLGRYGETLVVDWGLAKTLDQPEVESATSTERAESPLKPTSGSALEPTQAGSAVGTPGYMSPEQVDGRVGTLGVRSDVYCLGATLYHLLTGHAPCEAEQLGEIFRKVLAGHIPRPRSLNPRIAPALEAICLKALALNAEQRYGTAEGLKADLERWLADEPVSAWRERFSRRARRWMRLHRTLVTSTAAVLAFGLAGLGAFATVVAGKNRELDAKNSQLLGKNRELDARNQELDRQRHAAEDQRNRAMKAELAAREEESKTKKSQSETEAVLEFFRTKVLAAARPKDQEGGLGIDATIRAAVDAAEPGIEKGFADQPTVEASIRETLGESYLYLGEPELAIRQFKRTLSLLRRALGLDHPDTLTSHNNLAVAHRAAGRTADAIKMHEEELRLCTTKLGSDHPGTLTSRENLAIAYLDDGRTSDAIKMHEANLKLFRSTLGPNHPDTLISLNNLAKAYRAAGRTTDAIKMHEEELKLSTTELGSDHPDTLISRNNLAMAYLDGGRTAEAMKMHEATLKVRTSKLGPDHPSTLTSCNNLATGYESIGRWTEAERIRSEALARRRKTTPRDSPLLADDLDCLGHNSLKQSKWSQAETLLRECMAIRAKKLPDDWLLFLTMSRLGGALLGQRRYSEAEPLIVSGYKGMKAREQKIPAPGKPRLSEAADRVVRLYEAWGKREQASAWQGKLGVADLPADPFAPP